MLAAGLMHFVLFRLGLLAESDLLRFLTPCRRQIDAMCLQGFAAKHPKTTRDCDRFVRNGEWPDRHGRAGNQKVTIRNGKSIVLSARSNE